MSTNTNSYKFESIFFNIHYRYLQDFVQGKIVQLWDVKIVFYYSIFQNIVTLSGQRYNLNSQRYERLNNFLNIYDRKLRQYRCNDCKIHLQQIWSRTFTIEENL